MRISEWRICFWSRDFVVEVITIKLYQIGYIIIAGCGVILKVKSCVYSVQGVTPRIAWENYLTIYEIDPGSGEGRQNTRLLIRWVTKSIRVAVQNIQKRDAGRRNGNSLVNWIQRCGSCVSYTCAGSQIDCIVEIGDCFTEVRSNKHIPCNFDGRAHKPVVLIESLSVAIRQNQPLSICWIFGKAPNERLARNSLSVQKNVAMVGDTGSVVCKLCEVRKAETGVAKHHAHTTPPL